MRLEVVGGWQSGIQLQSIISRIPSMLPCKLSFGQTQGLLPRRYCQYPRPKKWGSFTISGAFQEGPALDNSSNRAKSRMNKEEAVIMQGIGMPNSLKALKSKKVKQGVGNSISKAFSSMVFMLKSVQSHSLHIRQLLFCEDVQGILSMVQQEMHCSLEWLFQQVFSCTPKLMISVMILLANFTVHSMGNNMAIGLEYPPALVSILRTEMATKNPQAANPKDLKAIFLPAGGNAATICPSLAGDGAKGGSGRIILVAGGTDGDHGRLHSSNSDGRTMYSEEETVVADAPALVSNNNQPLFMFSNVDKAAEKGNFEEDIETSVLLADKKGTKDEASFLQPLISQAKSKFQSFVAPVTAKLEPDNYECYEKTDLVYQHALSLDCGNSLLLANYARFLHLVRHDHDRAETYFLRAVGTDPTDGEAMSSLANFLWRGRKDVERAEKAYKEAVEIDPSNSFYAGNYAHFLWQTADEANPNVQ